MNPSDRFDTETIDMLFLELSQFTRATTAKELKLATELEQCQRERDEFRQAAERLAVVEVELEQAKDRLKTTISMLRAAEKQRDAAQEMVRDVSIQRDALRYHANKQAATIKRLKEAADIHLQLNSVTTMRDLRKAVEEAE